MAITLGTVGYLTLTVVFQDFRGQKKTVKIQLDPATPDASLIAVIGALDNLSNAKILTADVSANRLAAGMKSAAVSTGHEVNIDEVMEYTLYAINPVNAAKYVARTVGVPAMVSAQENIDGSPIAVTGVGGDTNPAPTTGAALDMYHLLNNLEAYMNIETAAGARSTPIFTYSPARSHHGEFEDIVDTH